MTTYYVSQSGNNGNGLSLVNAKTTIAAGKNLMSGGDTLLIDNGVYVEAIRYPNTFPAGTIGAPTRIKAINRGAVTMRPTGGNYGFTIRENYLFIDGIDADMVNSTGAPFAFTNGGTGVRGLTLQYCRARNGNGDISSSSGIVGVSIDDCLIAHNECDGNDTGTNQDHGIYISGSGATIIYNDCHDNGGYGLHFYSSLNNSLIFGNKVYGNILRGAILYGNNNLFYNNLIYRNAWSFEVAGNNNGVYNNLFYNNGSGSYAIWISSGTANIVKNNIYYANSQNSIQDDGSGTIRSNNLTADPYFVDAANDDFRLQYPSLAIGAGVNLSQYFTIDYNGFPRGTWDIGPLQYSSVIAGPNNLNATGLIVFNKSAFLNSNSLNVAGLFVFGSVANINVKEMVATGHI